ncbi:MAG: alcohol dehydrogenase catalytic domain-containing protein, partial [Candidatus Latescibacterota bacterium]|nr:alcohol dehydrogenase catalytic domain-containing protein [Candidatus Latescibacterota bacterium]
MKAVRFHDNGGPEVLKWEEVEDPAAAPGEVLIRLEAVGLNYIDTYHREGLYPVPLPSIPGVEGAGEVVALGDGVDDISLGDKVAYAGPMGSYAELA